MTPSQAPAPDRPSQQKTPEFRRYRQALVALYVATWVIGGSLGFVSVVVELFFPERATAPKPQPQDLVVCNERVAALLSDLGDTALGLQQKAYRSASEVESADAATEWETFSRAWHQRWVKVNDDCQFDHLADTGLGRAYDRMAWVHRTLPTVQLKTREMLRRFSKELSDELHNMQQALNTSRALLRATPTREDPRVQEETRGSP